MVSYSRGFQRVLYYLLHITLLHVLVATGLCEDGWAEFKGRCYRSFPDVPVNPSNSSLNNAIRFCRIHGAEVVLPQTEDEYQFLQDLTISDPTGKKRFFIGLQDMWIEGIFMGLKGQKVDYINWKSAQPDNGGILYPSENCLSFKISSKVVIDTLCTNNDQVDIFVCEKDEKYRTMHMMTVVKCTRITNSSCLIRSYQAKNSIDCGRKYLENPRALSYNFAKAPSTVSPNCEILNCTPLDVDGATAHDSQWTLYHFPEIFDEVLAVG